MRDQGALCSAHDGEGAGSPGASEPTRRKLVRGREGRRRGAAVWGQAEAPCTHMRMSMGLLMAWLWLVWVRGRTARAHSTRTAMMLLSCRRPRSLVSLAWLVHVVHSGNALDPSQHAALAPGQPRRVPRPHRRQPASDLVAPHRAHRGSRSPAPSHCPGFAMGTRRCRHRCSTCNRDPLLPQAPVDPLESVFSSPASAHRTQSPLALIPPCSPALAR